MGGSFAALYVMRAESTMLARRYPQCLVERKNKELHISLREKCLGESNNWLIDSSLFFIRYFLRLFFAGVYPVTGLEVANKIFEV